MAPVTRPFVPAGLQRKRRHALAALWFEQLWPALWPPLGVLGAYACAALLDLPALLPPWPRFGLLAGVLIVAGVLAWRGVRLFVRPTEALADRRLERASGLRHRPLATIGDRPSAATVEQEWLWREHVARLQRQVRRLRVGVPRPGLAARDARALRGGLLVALVACAVVAGPDAVGRLERGFLPQPPAVAPGPAVQIQAWITPPAYTGLPPVVLQTATPAVTVPVGSRLTVSLTGTKSEPALSVGEQSEPFRALDEQSWQAELVLERQADIVVRQGGASVARWALTLVPDVAPVPRFVEPPGPNVVADRPTLQSRFAWRATHEYGVVSLQIELRLRDRPEAPPLVLQGAIGGNPKDAHGVTVTDLTAHPWAGLPVLAQLVAKDAPGLEGRSDAQGFTLPARDFQNPVARALVAVRRQLSLTPSDRAGAAAVIDALSEQPEAFDGATGIFLNLRALSALLERGREPGTVDEAQARMWQLALALEEGGVERTARALAEARERLREALDPNREQRADQAEIDRRVQALRDAIQRQMQALAEEARREGAELQADPTVPFTDSQQLDRMLQQLQQDLHDGRTENAQREMAELEQMLEQLQNARPETGQQRAQRRAEGRQRGREQMNAIQDMIQREGSLLDQSRGRAAPQPQPPSPQPQQQGGDQPPQPPGDGQQQQQQGAAAPNGSSTEGAGEQRGHEARSQRAMRRALGELMQRYGDLTGTVPKPLGDADQAMRDAAQALAEGRDAAAGSAAQRAIEALQQGGQQMGQQIARQFGVGSQEGDGQEGENGQNPLGGLDNRDGTTSGPPPGRRGEAPDRRTTRRDPLGRPLHDGNEGSEQAGDVHVPDDMEQARTRSLQEELRRRGADRSRRQMELDYIDRLLRSY